MTVFSVAVIFCLLAPLCPCATLGDPVPTTVGSGDSGVSECLLRCAFYHGTTTDKGWWKGPTRSGLGRSQAPPDGAVVSADVACGCYGTALAVPGGSTL